MKNQFNTVVKAGVLAAALALAGAAHAGTDLGKNFKVEVDSTAYANVDANGDYGIFGEKFPQEIGTNLVDTVTIDVAKLTNNSNAMEQYLAFCIAPTVGLQGSAIYHPDYAPVVSNAIRGLYETSYGSLSADNPSAQAAFQLALWELANDDGNMSTGIQRFTSVYGNESGDAQNMISAATSYAGPYTYSFVSFTGKAGGLESQQLLAATVSAVPEADTWAMMALGLGLIGLIGRRKLGRSDTFA